MQSKLAVAGPLQDGQKDRAPGIQRGRPLGAVATAQQALVEIAAGVAQRLARQ